MFGESKQLISCDNLCLAVVQSILTSRVAVLGAGAACLLVANVQTGSVIQDYYKGQAGIPPPMLLDNTPFFCVSHLCVRASYRW